MAEGEAIRLLEFEALHHALAVRHGGTVAILGDFNTASQSAAGRPGETWGYLGRPGETWEFLEVHESCWEFPYFCVGIFIEV